LVDQNLSNLVLKHLLENVDGRSLHN